MIQKVKAGGSEGIPGFFFFVIFSGCIMKNIVFATLIGGKEMNKTKLQISVELLDGETITIESDEWDDFEIKHNLLIIRKENCVIAAFNMRKAVSYFLVEEQDNID